LELGHTDLMGRHGARIIKMSQYKKLIGKNIEKIKIADDKESFSIQFSDGTIAKFNAEGDCCSYSFIESIDNDELRGEIVSIEDIELDCEGADDPYTSYYGLKIITNKGHCVVDYRNENNGYYGGYIELEYPANAKQ